MNRSLQAVVRSCERGKFVSRYAERGDRYCHSQLTTRVYLMR